MAIGKPILEGSSQGQKRSTTQILTLSDPKIRGQEPKTLSKRAHNPLLKEAGPTKPTAAEPWLGGDWYLWHAPDGLRARAATGLGCVQAGAEKLGVIEASYASAIIGVPWRRGRYAYLVSPRRCQATLKLTPQATLKLTPS